MLEITDTTTAEEGDLSARAASLRSRAALHAGDRAAWLSLFADDAIVQDPVGPSGFDPEGEGHRGPDRIAAFWDNVIAPNPSRMTIHDSFAGGNEVANVITISSTFPDGSRADVPGVAIYKVDDEGKVLSLRAFWEMDQLTFVPAPG
ncbi:nuclear transport factor 2 family protein [soil metagenome]